MRDCRRAAFDRISTAPLRRAACAGRRTGLLLALIVLGVCALPMSPAVAASAPADLGGADVLAAPPSVDGGLSTGTVDTGSVAAATAGSSALAQLAVEQAQLFHNTAVYFGYSVAIDGDTALVGATETVVGTKTTGCAYVFVRSGSTWVEQAELVASELTGYTMGDYTAFGCSVAIDGDVALIGARGADPGGVSDAGAAYVFKRSGGVWTEQTELSPATRAAEDFFGCAVALDGNTTLIGARDADLPGASSAGAAYVFTYSSGAGWTQQGGALTAATPSAGDSFGTSVALDGATAVVGAPDADAGSVSAAGAAQVFTYSSSTGWTRQGGWLTAASPTASAYFGSSVALDGDTALIGAQHVSGGSAGSTGAAYVFVRSAATGWTQQAMLTPTDSDGYASAGVSVALRGNIAVVGAPSSSPGSVAQAGAAYVFTRSGTVWGQKDRLTASDKTSGDFFGFSVAISGNTVLAGAATARRASLSGTIGLSYALVLDAAAPTTTATGLSASASSNWSRVAVTVGLSGDDGSGYGVGSVHYTIDGGAEQTVLGSSASFAVSDQGSHAIAYWSKDIMGNVETPETGYANIDGRKPVTKAYRAAVKNGKKVKLPFRVNDPVPGCGQARVVLKIYKGKKLKKTVKVPGVLGCNVKKTYPWKCTLATGRYSVKVFATDIAGNRQSKVGSAVLTVR